jgi:polysaccharide biosynthesis protein PslE
MKTPHFWTIRDYFQAIVRFRWRVATVLVAAISLAVLYVLYVPRQYASESKLFVRVGRENAALDPTLTKGETMAVAASREEEMNSILEHLRSHQILERTLDKLDPSPANADAESRERAVISLGDAIYVSSPRSSTVVTIRGQAASASQAQKIVATMVDVYLEDHMRISRSQDSYQFFTDQWKRLADQLEVAQKELCDAKNKAGISSLETRRTAIEGQIDAVETRVHRVGAALAAADAKVNALNASIRPLPEPLLKQMLGGVPNDGLAAMHDQFFQLRVRQEAVRAKYTDAHPIAAAVHEQVREVADTLNHEEPERPHLITAITAQDTANRASLLAEKQCLADQLGVLQQRLAALNDDGVRIDKLARNVRQIETQYLAYAENKEQARMDQALRMERISNISIIQPATLSVLPVRPRKAFALFLATLAGMLAGCVVAVISEQWRISATTSTVYSQRITRANLDAIWRKVDRSQSDVVQEAEV